MDHKELLCGAADPCALEEDTYEAEQYEEVNIDAMIEEGRREYREAWWEYVSEFN